MGHNSIKNKRLEPDVEQYQLSRHYHEHPPINPTAHTAYIHQPHHNKLAAYETVVNSYRLISQRCVPVKFSHVTQKMGQIAKTRPHKISVLSSSLIIASYSPAKHCKWWKRYVENERIFDLRRCQSDVDLAQAVKEKLKVTK